MDYKNMFDLTGKVCIVTGGTGYLCSECVKAFRAFGAAVAVLDMREAESRWDGAEAPEYDLFIACDVSDTAQIKKAFAKVYETFGRIDVLVNSVAFGGAHGKDSWLENTPDEAWERGITGGLGTTFRCTREIIPYMKQNGGSIVNFCSMYGLVAPDLRIYGDSPQRQPANYGAAKAGVLQLTRYAAASLAPYGIRVNCVTPGPFPNPANSRDEQFNQKLADKTMLGRVGKSSEMAGAVLLLASGASSFMTGSNIVVDGGWTAW